MERKTQIAKCKTGLRFAICVLSLSFAAAALAQPPAAPPRSAPAATGQVDPKPTATSPQAPQPAEEKLYYLPYLMIAVAIAIGVLLVCRPSRRADG
jgi:hypothetical protein